MSIVFYDRNNLNSNYRPFLPLLESQFTTLPCDGLEAVTGCDLCLASTPIPPTDDMRWAIENKYIFVQLKFGNDIWSFDQTKSEIARVQRIGIPIQQAYLLFIGRCYPDANGLAFIDGKQAYTTDKPREYALFEELKHLVFKRGMLFDQIATENELSVWVGSLLKAIEKIGREGDRELYIKHPSKIEDNSSNIWQRILAVDESDWRNVIVNGLDGFGPVLANNTLDYLHQTGLFPCLYEALRVLTELNEKGKQVHDIAGWGKGSCQKLRGILGLQSSFELPKENRPATPYVQNLAAPMITNPSDPLGEWQRGVKASIGAFEVAMKSGVKDGKELLLLVQRAASCFDSWDVETFKEWREGLYCDDWLKVSHPSIYQQFIKEKIK